jgi:hypothetical protein
VRRRLREDLIDDAHLRRVCREFGAKAIAPGRHRLGAEAFDVADIGENGVDRRDARRRRGQERQVAGETAGARRG